MSEIPTPSNQLEKIYNGLCCVSAKLGPAGEVRPESRAIQLCVDTSTPESAVPAVQTTLFDPFTAVTISIHYHDMIGTDITSIVTSVVPCL